MHIWYHNDMDGRASAYVALLGWRLQHRFDKQDIQRLLADGGLTLVAMDYGTPPPVDRVGLHEEVWIVDFSIAPEDMRRLLKVTDHIVWIDHHQTAIARYTEADMAIGIPGKRRSGTAACVLTWEYLVECGGLVGQPPRAIQLVGDRDVWDFKLGNDTACFHAGAASFDTRPESSFWVGVCGHGEKVNERFREDSDPVYVTLGQVLTRGKMIMEMRAQQYRDLRERIAFRAVFAGYPVLAMNICGAGSEAFGDLDNMYAGGFPEGPHRILMPFYHDGTKFAVSLYSRKGDLDVSVLAKARGGGGHANAAGFQCETLPFEDVTPFRGESK